MERDLKFRAQEKLSLLMIVIGNFRLRCIHLPGFNPRDRMAIRKRVDSLDYKLHKLLAEQSSAVTNAEWQGLLERVDAILVGKSAGELVALGSLYYPEDWNLDVKMTDGVPDPTRTTGPETES